MDAISGRMMRRFPCRLLAAAGAAALAAGVLNAGPAAAARAPSWSLVSTPPVKEPGGALSAVSCPTPGACSAVGEFDVKTFFTQAPVGEAWNGARWNKQQMPTPAGTSELFVTGESCTSASACTAVGSVNPFFAPTSLVDRWDGTRWTMQSIRIPSRAIGIKLTGVSCWSATGCMAVGQYEVQLDEGTRWVSMAELWNGSAWTMSQPRLSADGVLSAVSCVSATACVAVGQKGRKPSAEIWNGSAWTIPPAPTVRGVLSAVSCTSAGACLAVGSTQRGTTTGALAERWDGTSWTVVLRSPRSGAQLKAVSCSSAGACTAVGTGSAGALAERWNGSTWAVQPVRGPAGAGLNGVSCSSATACTAVGGAAGVTLAERWNGTGWTVQPTPNPIEILYAPLSSVSCSSVSACTVAGYYTSVAGSQIPLAERWNGRSWAIQRMPGQGDIGGVSCPAATDCEAVGSNGSRPLAQAWTGTRWVSQRIPGIAGARSASLDAVSCASATACTAVGRYITHSGQRDALAERWNGTAWARQVLPAVPDGKATRLLGVSCASASACTAVGQYFNRALGLWRTLAEAWNGTTWVIQPTPDPSGTGVGFYNPALTGVSCVSPGTCIAVGRFADLTLAERWNGTNWTIQPTPNPSTIQSTLYSVSCPSASACIAVGTQYGGINDPVDVTLAEAFDGSTWTAQRTPSLAEGGSAYLYGVSCPSASACIAVGDQDATLAERYS
jgi:hypothetical protein